MVAADVNMDTRSAPIPFDYLQAFQGAMSAPAGKPDISGPQGKSEDQPHAKQIAPAEGVTPPAEVHACPTVYSAPCTIRLPLPAYRGDRLAFAPHTAGLWPDCSMSA
jgi:hypothetical protein